MVSLGINGIDYIAGCYGVSPTRMSRAQCGPAGKLPDDTPTSEWRTRRDGPGPRAEPAEGRRRSRRASGRGDAARGCSRSGSPGLGYEDGMTFLNEFVERGIRRSLRNETYKRSDNREVGSLGSESIYTNTCQFEVRRSVLPCSLHTEGR